MEINRAMQIVFDMASQNVIDEFEAQADPRLVQTRQEQETALTLFAEWAKAEMGLIL